MDGPVLVLMELPDSRVCPKGQNNIHSIQIGWQASIMVSVSRASKNPEMCSRPKTNIWPGPNPCDKIDISEIEAIIVVVVVRVQCWHGNVKASPTFFRDGLLCKALVALCPDLVCSNGSRYVAHLFSHDRCDSFAKGQGDKPIGLFVALFIPLFTCFTNRFSLSSIVRICFGTSLFSKMKLNSSLQRFLIDISLFWSICSTISASNNQGKHLSLDPLLDWLHSHHWHLQGPSLPISSHRNHWMLANCSKCFVTLKMVANHFNSIGTRMASWLVQVRPRLWSRPARNLQLWPFAVWRQLMQPITRALFIINSDRISEPFDLWCKVCFLFLEFVLIYGVSWNGSG